MKIGVVGLWHLGLVTATCLAAEGHDVCAIDAAEIVAAIEAGHLPIEEPGLAQLIKQNRAAGRLTFAAGADAARGSELLWFCYDTPVNDNDEPDVPWVIDRISGFLNVFEGRAVVAVSSQLPVGTIALVRERCPSDRFAFACIPENLRLGTALDYFRNPDRFVVGISDLTVRGTLEQALRFVSTLVWTSIESAEVIKHAINAYLATSVVFANEIASLCERVGADSREVERGLKSDMRIGSKAYVRAGEAFAGGTLARDLQFLAELGKHHALELTQLRATQASNTRHRDWVIERIDAGLGIVAGCRVALLGLVYKPGTNTLRASNAVQLARKLLVRGAQIVAFDPAIPIDDTRVLSEIELTASAQAALHGADCAVVATSWPQFRELDASVFMALRKRLVIDEARFLEQQLQGIAGLDYIAFGRPSVAARVAG